ncbi:phage tail sheath gpL-like [Rhodoblastus acidophilus]|uniref:DUF5681 domain-containing protein n=1 Tax=Rhodoblastus acidophilus TaxID=1074 RepID=UPI0022256E5E|nr:DUF5681 domain-containing protein [Rhodoblastus acidophilus]MCW2286225.1 phage tail sheath gpL-like [Rhodoblastus acidophilus]MCW2335092.1 phage tail sheath gpL-like [Rhodoblastus acidophilus]
MAENAAGKQRGAPFKKGQSGNPKGKPKGARHKVTILAEKLMEDEAEAVIRAVVDKAKEGDMTAARIVVDRIAPVRKGRPIQLKLPKVETADDVAAAMAAIISAMADGAITPEEATAAASVLEARRRAIETQEFERRLAALEEQGKGQ